jgi:hypothetical protein
MNNDDIQKDVEEVNTDISILWENTSPQITKGRMPLYYNTALKRNGVLFIGINPSYSHNGLLKIVQGMKADFVGHSLSDIDDYFAHPNISGKFEIHQSILMDDYARQHYPYFDKFKLLTPSIFPDKNEEELQDCWEHIDLFVVRETKQKRLEESIYQGKGKKKLNDFAITQLKIAHKLIELIKPKVIVVANAKASQLMRKQSDIFLISDTLNNKTGFYEYELKEGVIPIVFTSMLTGQRALDNFSFERLKWQLSMLKSL